jgi:hypothetical protein
MRAYLCAIHSDVAVAIPFSGPNPYPAFILVEAFGVHLLEEGGVDIGYKLVFSHRFIPLHNSLPGSKIAPRLVTRGQVVGRAG